MREISPVGGMTPEQFLSTGSPHSRELVESIRKAKAAGSRPLPSSTLIDRSELLTPELRCTILDRIAALVDENLFGRSEMCFQFSDLLQRALVHLGLPARAVLGIAKYYIDGREVFHWKHSWVRVGREVIDGNVDSIRENPQVPNAVEIAPYWGPINETPPDRLLRQNRSLSIPIDSDVSNIWWPELETWLKNTIAQDRA